ncbi:cytochrome b [Pseudosulfitobacter koreensis]|uniref:Cytochrome b/b6 domain-containing protein n=1 Tax=Pseudosulfitobacter koreensis TaxID=2968472 RepID=A0ABT1YY31_9RHOB|nr:cytochrome b/b6 domain-containing protein [Pseudosulfitobacter koreense]MCR8825787.1 cytochrome b/b6 domain-containing protein [Pseudosulfitobacter koreense]
MRPDAMRGAGVPRTPQEERTMPNLTDSPHRYGLVSRWLHWGMAALFAAQFLSAAAHWALPRENALRDLLWGYHPTLGTLLFLLVLLRGAWGLANIRRRPAHLGRLGQAATLGHLAIYALMVIVPGVRLLAAAGSKGGLSVLGLVISPAREAEIAWMRAPAAWHGEMGWVLAALILGHIAMAVLWHRLIRRDDTLKRMAR